jgi:hypothetical protein
MSKASCRDVGSDQVNTTEDHSSAWTNRRATEQATRAAKARLKSGRRRFVDPTTSERAYTEAELEFMLAMNEYKHQSGRMFPTWSEVLEVLQSLGYEKIPDAERQAICLDRRAPAGFAAR